MTESTEPAKANDESCWRCSCIWPIVVPILMFVPVLLSVYGNPSWDATIDLIQSIAFVALSTYAGALLLSNWKSQDSARSTGEVFAALSALGICAFVFLGALNYLCYRADNGSFVVKNSVQEEAIRDYDRVIASAQRAIMRYKRLEVLI